MIDFPRVRASVQGVSEGQVLLGSPAVADHEIPHDLGFDLAKRAAIKAVEVYGEKFAEYDYEATWVSDERVELSFTVRGKRIEGAMTVKPHKVDLELDVPLLFRPFRGMALGIIESEAKMWLEKAKRGELTE